MPWKAEGSTGNKQHLYLSANADTVMQLDELVFIGEKNHSGFVSTVFENYRDTVNEEIRRERQRRRTALNAKRKPTDSEKRWKEKLRAEDEAYRDELSQTYPREVIHKIVLRKKQHDYLYGNCMEQDLYNNPSDYLKIVLERYAELDVGQREKVFFSKLVKTLTNACKNECLLDITTGNKRLRVRPYGIVQSNVLPYFYLVGMSQKVGSRRPETPAPFRLYRITDVHENAEKSGVLTEQERNQLADRLQKQDVAYLLDPVEDITVQLTPMGKKLLANKQFQRPLPPENEKKAVTGDIFHFRCAAKQAKNYFCAFGEDALILEPKHLRDEMQEMYRKAFQRYQEQEEEENNP